MWSLRRSLDLGLKQLIPTRAQQYGGDDDDDDDDTDDDDDEYFSFHSYTLSDWETTAPFVGWVSRVPSEWQEIPKPDTKYPHDHNATVLQTFASSTLPAKSYISERVTKQNSQL